jgi:hypothetical protein
VLRAYAASSVRTALSSSTSTQPVSQRLPLSSPPSVCAAPKLAGTSCTPLGCGWSAVRLRSTLLPACSGPLKGRVYEERDRMGRGRSGCAPVSGVLLAVAGCPRRSGGGTRRGFSRGPGSWWNIADFIKCHSSVNARWSENSRIRSTESFFRVYGDSREGNLRRLTAELLIGHMHIGARAGGTG